MQSKIAQLNKLQMHFPSANKKMLSSCILVQVLSSCILVPVKGSTSFE